MYVIHKGIQKLASSIVNGFYDDVVHEQTHSHAAPVDLEDRDYEMEEDEFYYLMPGFRLDTLTIPRLRAILIYLNIPYPTCAKKDELLRIMEEEVLPKTNDILEAQVRARRLGKDARVVLLEEGVIPRFSRPGSSPEFAKTSALDGHRDGDKKGLCLSNMTNVESKARKDTSRSKSAPTLSTFQRFRGSHSQTSKNTFTNAILDACSFGPCGNFVSTHLLQDLGISLPPDGVIDLTIEAVEEGPVQAGLTYRERFKVTTNEVETSCWDANGLKAVGKTAPFIP
ncbi:uncharacterized protein Z520_03139 [Fonsecaea multimorphosa CBS 102226]|uniref:HeH/LEM domain-containing protein n=1 Tax=Fonsecaea multimorphosa CBS 102226 TaxID=1442371 RepID=A0A0D2IX42_9EURO|nr:uncharacterized protein Z520_03139 [Fonsecaea multimorphosa CBS 102226]KIY01587.1 hypothetical protein Z520_03139 [Fonsecaea multimorphosa CBS 102226]OAL28099.1 hypothetical protein AYO22_03126 [Fonsecaea multimorphosa]